MSVFTDNAAYGAALLPPGVVGTFAPAPAPAQRDGALLRAMFGDAELVSAPLAVPGWHRIFASDFAHGSQYDRLIQLAREITLPDRIACVARAGAGFHGFRGRAWNASPGNIHLTVHLAPERPIERFETVFTALAAVAVVDTIDAIEGLAGQAHIKWVNDVLVQGAKVAGVLAYTQTRADAVTSVILGIGLNVETRPAVERSIYVPAAGSLREFAPDPAAAATAPVLHTLLRSLDRLYSDVLAQGHAPIMERYRARCAVLGRDVTICAEDGDDGGAPTVVAAGRVIAVGDGLELYLSDHAEPITKGRLILGTMPEGGG